MKGLLTSARSLGRPGTSSRLPAVYGSQDTGEGRRLHERNVDHRLECRPAIVGSGIAWFNEFSRDVPALGDAIGHNLPALIWDRGIVLRLPPGRDAQIERRLGNRTAAAVTSGDAGAASVMVPPIAGSRAQAAPTGASPAGARNRFPHRKQQHAHSSHQPPASTIGTISGQSSVALIGSPGHSRDLPARGAGGRV